MKKNELRKMRKKIVRQKNVNKKFQYSIKRKINK